MQDWLSYLAPLAAGVVLAAVAGLRSFLPLFAVGLAARLDLLVLGPAFAFLATTPALVALASAAVFEVLGDKFPAVDHALDVLGTAVRPLAGAVSVAAVAGGIDPLWTAVLAVVLGGGTAGAVHLVKAKTRVGSSLLSAGLANPIVSALEDAVALAGAALAVLWPFVALAMLAAAAAAVWLGLRLARRLWRGAPARPAI